MPIALISNAACFWPRTPIEDGAVRTVVEIGFATITIWVVHCGRLGWVMTKIGSGIIGGSGIDDLADHARQAL